MKTASPQSLYLDSGLTGVTDELPGTRHAESVGLKGTNTQYMKCFMG